MNTNPTKLSLIRRGRRARLSPPESVLCPTMPVLDRMTADIGGIDDSVRTFFGLQHLFGSTATLLRKISRERIDPRSVFVLGKPYSANREVVHYLATRLGYRVHPSTCMQRIGEANDDEMDRRIEAVLSAIRRRLNERRDSDSRVLLVDDGGRAIRLLHTERYADIRDRFTCVEQTRCGIRTLEDTKLRVPVINVAESWVKLEHESPMIAESVTRELGRQLAAMEARRIRTGRHALIIGFGAIGRAVGVELRRRGLEVAVHDARAEHRIFAKQEGFETCSGLSDALRGGGLIVGCTGKPALDREHYRQIPNGSILVSASSADVEFRGWQLRADAECLGRPESWGKTGHGPDRNHPCFSLYRARNRLGRFYLVNGGFPVNFSGGVDPIPPEKIQLTRSLLYLGAVQASLTEDPGLHPLDDGLQRNLMEALADAQRRRAA